MIFAPEDSDLGFRDVAPAPDVVLDALLNTEEAKKASEYLDPLDREGRRKCFSVVRIDLATEKDEDYIATGNCAMLGGADNNWFWIVHVDQGRARVTLFTGGLAVTILNRKTNGFRDIEQAWAGNSGSVTHVYKYNGTVYKQVSEHFQKAKP